MKNRGFTLIELTVSIAMTAVFILIISVFSKNVIDFFGTANRNKNLLDAMEELRFTLAANDQCAANFAGKNVSGPVTAVSSYDKSGVAVAPILSLNQKFEGAIIQSIAFRSNASLSTSLLQADLVVRFQDTLSPVPAANLERTLPLILQVQAGIISNCWVIKDKVSIEISQICLGATGGVLNSYDPSTKRCILANGKWFPGSSSSASCPQGTLLPANANSDYNCGVEPEDFGDSSSIVANFQMTDGSSYSVGPPPVLKNLDIAKSQCTCDWAIDIAPTLLQNVHCRILCVVPQ